MNIVVITGASRGIGRAIAVKLVQSGYEVHGTFNSSKNEAEKLSKEYGIKFHPADLSNRQETLKLAEELARLDVFALINNAGIWEMDNIKDMNYETWDRTIEVNLNAPLILSTMLAKTMNKGASIVNISSTDGLTGGYNGLSYSASKAGLISITKSLGNTLAAKGIRVNAVAPGWIDTAMVTDDIAASSSKAIPLGRNGRPEEIADLVEFLISNKASYINGETIAIDGGLFNTDLILKQESGY